MSRSCTGPSTTSFSTVSSSLGKLGSEDHEMRLETRATKIPFSSSQVSRTLQRETRAYQIEDSQGIVHDTEIESNCRKPTICTGRLVLVILNWDAGNDLETKEECHIFCVRSISFEESGRETANFSELSSRQIDERKRHEFSDLGKKFMTASMKAAIFLGKNCSKNLQSTRNSDQKSTVQSLFDVTRTLIREQELDILGVS